MSGLLVKVTSWFSYEAKPKPLFLESWTSAVVVILFILQAALLGFLVDSTVECLPEFDDVVLLIEEGKFLPNIRLDLYLCLICGTQIRWDAKGLFIEKTLFLGLLILIFHVNKDFVLKINRYDTILSRQKDKVFLGPHPVIKGVDYKNKMRFVLVRFLLAKFVFLLLLIAGVVVAFTLILAIDKLHNIMRLNGVHCGPSMDFAPDLHTRHVCHLEQEVFIYILYIATSVVSFLLLALYAGSLVMGVYYLFFFPRHIIDPASLDPFFHPPKDEKKKKEKKESLNIEDESGTHSD